MLPPPDEDPGLPEGPFTLTLRGLGAGVMSSWGVVSRDICLRRYDAESPSAFAVDTVLRNVADPVDAPLRRTTLCATGLPLSGFDGDPAKLWCRIAASPLVLSLATSGGDEDSIFEGSSFRSAFVKALNFMGAGMSSSELSPTDTGRISFTREATDESGDPRFKFGRDGRFRDIAGRGVGEAVAMSASRFVIRA